jgi:hypothetical protein
MKQEIQIKDNPTINMHAQTLEIIKAASSDANVSAEKMKQLLELQIMAMDYQKRIDFDAALIDLQKNMPLVVKTRVNNQTNSKYAALEDILEQIRPTLERFGFTVLFKPLFNDTMVGAKVVLRHKSGHSEEAEYMLPLDNKGIKGTVNKTDIHASASSLTYAKRYALCALLGISTGDNDGNSSVGMIRGLTAAQISQITQLLMQCSEATQEWFKTNYTSTNKIPADKFNFVYATLKNAISKSQNKSHGNENANN